MVFVFDWREVAEGRMESYRVVKGLDVIKEGGLSLLQVQGNLVVEALSLERGPETLHGGVTPGCLLGRPISEIEDEDEFEDDYD